MVDAEVARNRSCAVASQKPAAPLLLLVFAQLWPPTKPCPTSAGCLAPQISAPDNALSFILSEGIQKRDEAAANRRRQVEIAPVQDPDQRVTSMHALNNCDSVKHRARGTIPFRQDENVAFAEMVNGPFELRPALNVLGARFFTEDFRAPLCPQRRDLPIQMLMWRRHARVADLCHSEVSVSH